MSILVHMFGVLSVSIYYILKNHSRVSELSSIVSIILMVLIILLTIPIGGLTGFHFLLIIRGRTTNEQVTGKFKTNINPFDYGCYYNCSKTFSSSKYPQLTNSKSSLAKKKSNLYQVEIPKENGKAQNKPKHISMTSV